MSSSGKASGGSSKVDVYYGTIAAALGVGPLWSLEYILINGKKLQLNLEPGGADYIDGEFEDLGSWRIYAGTKTQTADPALEAFESQPAYRGIVYIVLKDFCFGKNGETNPPNIEVCWRRLPNQSIISNTGGAASNDGAFSANPVASAAELLTSWDWAGLDSAKINADSF